MFISILSVLLMREVRLKRINNSSFSIAHSIHGKIFGWAVIAQLKEVSGLAAI